MEWYYVLSLILGSFVFLMLLGTPVAFAFLFVNLGGVIFYWGGAAGLRQLVLNIFTSVASFGLMPVPMYVLIGEVIFLTGVATSALDALDKWLGRIPGRLALLSVAGGTVFATLSGSSAAGVAMLGSVLAPEMKKRGYKNPMILGPILGSGGLSIMIPPTALGVLLAALAKISVGAILISIIIPGLCLGIVYAAYIIIRCKFQPSLAPTYEIPRVPLRQKLNELAKYVMPLGIIVFLVIIVVFIGVATPSEAAAMGALGSFGLAAAYGKLTWKSAKKAIFDTTRITVMILMIFTGASAFSQILAFSGSTEALAQVAARLPIHPILVLIVMQIILLFMGCFMEPLSIMMITIPVFMPIVDSLKFNTLWFGTIMLLNMEMATLSPPFGMALFAMKGVAPPDTTMEDIYKGSIPFLLLQFIVMAAMIIFPPLVLWLPGKMVIR